MFQTLRLFVQTSWFLEKKKKNGSFFRKRLPTGMDGHNKVPTKYASSAFLPRRLLLYNVFEKSTTLQITRATRTVCAF
jgi:hypothetical protein